MGQRQSELKPRLDRPGGLATPCSISGRLSLRGPRAEVCPAGFPRRAARLRVCWAAKAGSEGPALHLTHFHFVTVTCQVPMVTAQTSFNLSSGAALGVPEHFPRLRVLS